MVVKVVFVVVIVVADGSQVSMRKRIDGLVLQDFASFTSSILLMLLFFIVVEIFFWSWSPNCPTTFFVNFAVVCIISNAVKRNLAITRRRMRCNTGYRMLICFLLFDFAVSVVTNNINIYCTVVFRVVVVVVETHLFPG